MQQCLLAPSILSADFARLGAEVSEVLQAGADVVHFDVMDNHYVPNLTFGPMVCQALRKYGIDAPIDVHLMTEPVDNLIVAFAKAGATYITFHPEASHHVDRSLKLIHDNGCKGGLVFNPAAPIDCLEYMWDKLDMILLMSVNPGFGGQKFIPSTLKKIAKVRDLIKSKCSDNPPLLGVDGGVNLDNLSDVVASGANFVVMGSAIFDYHGQYQEIISKMKKVLMRGVV